MAIEVTGNDLVHVSLCSGIGGFDLAAEWAGFETIVFCECDPYAQKVLNKHWPNVPIIGDIHDVTRERIKEIVGDAERSGLSRDSRGRTGEITKDGYIKLEKGNKTGEKDFPPINLITGGIPCQPVSIAGKRRGATDDRWLWPEALRILSEIEPTWAVFENPTGLLTIDGGLVFEDLLSRMEASGYEVQPIIIPACAKNAPHRRDRVFVLAHSIHCTSRWGEGSNQKTDCLQGIDRSALCSRESSGTGKISAAEIDTHSDSAGQRKRRQEESIQSPHNTIKYISEIISDPGQLSERRTGRPGNEDRASDEFTGCGSRTGKDQWSIEPDVGRVANGGFLSGGQT